MQETYHVGTDQPIVNFIVNLAKTDMKFLPYQYCMADLYNKQILDEELTFTKVIPGIYQFNAIPNNNNAERTLYWMKKTYKHFYGNK